MKIRSAPLGAVVAALALAWSCATPPPAAEPEAPPPAPVEQTEPAVEPAAPSVDAPDGLKAEAAELRKKAFDLGIKDVLPAEYAAAEESYALGNEKYGKDNAASAAAYEAAKSRFSDAISQGLPLLAAREGEKAREAEASAVGKGADSYFGAEREAASSALAEAGATEESGDFEAAIAGYRAAASSFAALGAMCDAATVRDAIAARDFAKWDTSNWTIAEGKLGAARDLLAEDSKASYAAADEAVLRYKLVMQNALSYYMADRKTFSETEMQRASGIKSEVAVKDEYEAATSLYAEAEEKRGAEDFESASELYDRSARAFAEAYDLAKSKMDAATSELESLDAALETAAAR